MRRFAAIAVCIGLATLPAPAGGKKHKSVRYATSWSEAVDEAQALNLPIVIHRHGFY